MATDLTIETSSVQIDLFFVTGEHFLLDNGRTRNLA
jgi:hypothetical protein